MSSDFITNFGYVIQINEDSINAFNITKEMLVDRFGKKGWNDKDKTVLDILDELAMGCEDLKLTIRHKEINVELFYYGECYSQDSLDEGSYFLFDKDDLFISTRSELMENLGGMNVEPELKSWLSYG